METSKLPERRIVRGYSWQVTGLTTIPTDCEEMSDKGGVAMITEFFYPRCGGVETHVQSLAKELYLQGFHVWFGL